ncbi:MAG: LuxR C-terminal-related transcriptional regulator [Treponema sp.]|nr:LuxR C-terminal-related transcriptional regulator [Treponema sp.]
MSRWEKLFSYYKTRLEQLGFQNVHVTGEEKDSLNMVLNELKPRLILMGSGFYSAATPYMVGQLKRNFPRINIAVINIDVFPDDMAPWFVWFGAKSYVNWQEGEEEFILGLEEVRQGNTYVAPNVKRLVDSLEGPEIKGKPEKRQMEVLMLLCNGFIPLQIGEKLHISKRTVDWHIEELKKVFGVQTREELISFAFYLDLVTKEDLCFLERKIKIRPLPKWTVIKQRTGNRERITMSS